MRVEGNGRVRDAQGCREAGARGADEGRLSLDEPEADAAAATDATAAGHQLTLGVLVALLGLSNLHGRCPYCRSEHVRVSRERYRGSLATALRLTPFRCRRCKRHFAVPSYARLTRRESPQRHCPRCGGVDVIGSSEPLSLPERMLGRERARCATCNRRFVYTPTTRVLANLLLAMALLAGVGIGIGVINSLQGKPAAKALKKR